MQVSKIFEVTEPNFELKENEHNKVTIYPFTPVTAGVVSGQFLLKADSDRARHCILIGSRFNETGREENQPFPGWFIQIVGDTLSLAIGNGSTWSSIKSEKKIENDIWHHVTFSLNNDTKIGQLNLDNQRNIKENYVFKKPCDFLTIGGLNANEQQYNFKGSIVDFKLGSILTPVKQTVVENTNSDQNIILSIQTYLEQSNICLDNIKKNTENIDNDIVSLNNIKEQVTEWKHKGLQLDIDSIHNQLEHISNKKEYTISMVGELFNKLKIVDDRINNRENNNEHIESTINIIECYKTTFRNLIDDVELLDSAITELSEYRELGLKLGNAFQIINEQKQSIFDTIKLNTIELKKLENESLLFSNILKI